MAEAAQSHVQIDELQERASAILAAATGAEAGLVTSGAEAGLLLGTAACLAGMDPRKMDDLPFVHDGRNEVVVQRGHRNAYDHALRAAGARLRRGRLPGGARGRLPLRLADRGGHHPEDGRRGLPDHGHARHGLAAGGRARSPIGTGCR